MKKAFIEKNYSTLKSAPSLNFILQKVNTLFDFFLRMYVTTKKQRNTDRTRFKNTYVEYLLINMIYFLNRQLISERYVKKTSLKVKT